MLAKAEYYPTQGEQHVQGGILISEVRSSCETQNRFIGLVRKARLPSRQDPEYAERLRLLHSGILGLCALIESFPYSVEPWVPSLTDGEFQFRHEHPRLR